MSNTTKTPFFKKHAVVWTLIGLCFIGLFAAVTYPIYKNQKQRIEKLEEQNENILYQMQLIQPSTTTTD